MYSQLASGVFVAKGGYACRWNGVPLDHPNLVFDRVMSRLCTSISCCLPFNCISEAEKRKNHDIVQISAMFCGPKEL